MCGFPGSPGSPVVVRRVPKRRVPPPARAAASTYTQFASPIHNSGPSYTQFRAELYTIRPSYTQFDLYTIPLTYTQFARRPAGAPAARAPRYGSSVLRPSSGMAPTAAAAGAPTAASP